VSQRVYYFIYSCEIQARNTQRYRSINPPRLISTNVSYLTLHTYTSSLWLTCCESHLTYPSYRNLGVSQADTATLAPPTRPLQPGFSAVNGRRSLQGNSYLSSGKLLRTAPLLRLRDQLSSLFTLMLVT
jgi:hypothetical protein